MPDSENIDEPASQRQHNEDRMRRADAWIKRSEQDDTEDIERFMFLWVAFNAAYGNEAALSDFVDGEEGRESESRYFMVFLENIVEQDVSGALEKIVWEEFSGPIRVLLNNHYVFRRLYTLRNQIFHGGATYPSGFGRTQIRDGSRIMASLVPAIIDIMKQDLSRDPDSETWGKVAYPRINAEPE